MTQVEVVLNIVNLLISTTVVVVVTVILSRGFVPTCAEYCRECADEPSWPPQLPCVAGDHHYRHRHVDRHKARLDRTAGTRRSIVDAIWLIV